MKEFIAALLMHAAEHRLRAENLRSLRLPLDSSWARNLNQMVESDAREQDGLAEVYDKFTWRLLGDVLHDRVIEDLLRISAAEPLIIGPVELLEPKNQRPDYLWGGFAGPLWGYTPPPAPFRLIAIN